MNGIEDLAADLTNLRSQDIAAPVLDKLRLHVVDTLGAWIAGMATAEGRALIGFRNDMARMANADASDSVCDDVALYCAATRLSEVDDIHLASMTTAGAIAIPTALAMATALADGRDTDIPAAMLAGYEAMIRLGTTIKGPHILYRGIWPTYFTAPFGAAAVAARLMRLDDRQTAQALALAVTLGAPSVGQHHAATTSRWLSVGLAVRNGLAAAFAARAGFTSDTGVLQSRLLPDIYAIDPDLGAMATSSGPAFAKVSFKPWCAARQTMAATQALRELLDNGLVVDAITAIDVSVPPPHLKMIDHGVTAGDRASHLTSLPYQMAVAALMPDTQLDVAQAPAHLPAAVQALMARIRVTADAALLADYPAAWPARIVVHTATSLHERLVRHVPGDAMRPLPERDIESKYVRLVSPVIGGARAENLLKKGQSVVAGEGEASLILREMEQIRAALAGGRLAGQA